MDLPPRFRQQRYQREHERIITQKLKYEQCTSDPGLKFVQGIGVWS